MEDFPNENENDQQMSVEEMSIEKDAPESHEYKRERKLVYETFTLGPDDWIPEDRHNDTRLLKTDTIPL